MRHFDTIESAYQETDRFLAQAQRSMVLPIQGEMELPPVVDAKYVNDRAYFVLLVAQFEELVNDGVERLIEASKRLPDWRHREIWNALVPATNRIQDIPFKKRLALLIDRQRVEYRDACGLYDVRNRIAHGRLDNPVSIQTAINQLRAVASLIQEVP
ncbi:hypothetical protein [Niveispirillum sp. KHB5.9]|uniref:hypothetical protein n=1 Tax=Niveispirillum sp. KHB5.9 TaxID=3400269 RepID=UPI003A880301